MLSIEECRKILGPKEYTDQEIEELRDTSYQLANTLFQKYIEDKRNNISLEERIKISERDMKNV